MSAPYRLRAQHRLRLVGRHLAAAQVLRLEFSLRLEGAQLRTRPAPLFWVGAAHRDSQADFARLGGLLRALGCPAALLECHRTRSADSLYQGVALDLDAARVRGQLFMHYRDATGDRRLGVGWDGDLVACTGYDAGRLSQDGSRDWLLSHVHRDYRDLLTALLRDARLVGQGGYWVQRRAARATELYLTYPWHPPLTSLAPALARHLPGPSAQTWRRYANAPVRHIGFSCQPESPPAVTLYASAPHAGPWPLSLRELQSEVMAQ